MLQRIDDGLPAGKNGIVSDVPPQGSLYEGSLVHVLPEEFQGTHHHFRNGAVDGLGVDIANPVHLCFRNAGVNREGDVEARKELLRISAGNQKPRQSRHEFPA